MLLGTPRRSRRNMRMVLVLLLIITFAVLISLTLLLGGVVTPPDCLCVALAAGQPQQAAGASFSRRSAATLGTWLGCEGVGGRYPQVVCALAEFAGGVSDDAADVAMRRTPEQAARLKGVPPGAIGFYVGVGTASNRSDGTVTNSDTASEYVFQCLDGSQTVPLAMVNDDFCDCPDGSDEPGTSACAGFAGRCFYCRNEGSRPKFIYASRVGDGVCDCCDGSDEEGVAATGSVATRAGEAVTRCADVCLSKGADVRAARAARRAELLEGQRLRAELASSAVTEVAAWRVEKAELDKSISTLEKANDAAKSRLDVVRAAVDEERRVATAAKEAARKAADAAAAEAAVQAAATRGQAEEVLLFEDFEAEGAAQGWAVAEAGGTAEVAPDPHGGRGKVLRLRGCTWGGDAFSRASFACGDSGESCRISFWAWGAPWQGFSRGTKRTEDPLADAHSWLAVPEAHAAAAGFQDRLLAPQSKAEWVHYEYAFPEKDSFQMFGSEEVRFSTSQVHIMLQAHASTGHCEDTMFDDFKVWRVAAPVEKASQPTGAEEAASAAAESPPMASTEVVDPPSVDDASKEEHQKPEVSEYAKWALDQDKVATTFEDASEPEKREGSESLGGGSVASEAVTQTQTQSERELDQARDDHNAANRAFRDAKNRRDDLEKRLAIDVGEGLRWQPLVAKCEESAAKEYTYSICFFEEARQGHTRLGTFDGWAKDTPLTMIFANGEHCHGGPARSLRVRFICGVSSKILGVKEPSRCTYEADVSHPAACGEDALRDHDANEPTAAGAAAMPHHDDHDEL
eukprot:TRINITY_DN24172_c0_g6_i1.p1 TRINITY_DN24172_c0_g6~~TRINITY_DN24172_c0_g6_i1.p1  ORF type:complete len:799 (-),score=167.07 TRINITY_DN24172_c0_g6_i1:113-2509(-)